MSGVDIKPSMAINPAKYGECIFVFSFKENLIIYPRFKSNVPFNQNLIGVD